MAAQTEATTMKKESPWKKESGTKIALGLEGSANKLGVGIIAHPATGRAIVLSNIRHTYITPPGHGFQPNHTAKHHKEHITRLIAQSLAETGLSSTDLDCICFVRFFPSQFLLQVGSWHH